MKFRNRSHAQHRSCASYGEERRRARGATTQAHIPLIAQTVVLGEFLRNQSRVLPAIAYRKRHHCGTRSSSELTLRDALAKKKLRRLVCVVVAVVFHQIVCLSREARLDLAVEVLEKLLSGQRKPNGGEKKALVCSIYDSGRMTHLCR